MSVDKEETPKHKDKVEALDSLSLGISIVVAVLVGVGLGLLLKSWTGYAWTLWIGVFWGVAAAVLNVYKAYKKIKKNLDKLAEEPRYKYQKEHGYNNIDDDD